MGGRSTSTSPARRCGQSPPRRSRSPARSRPTMSARGSSAAASVSAGPGARIVIGRDTRESGPSLENALVEGVVAAGGRALRAGVIPTPAVAVLTRLEGAERGCVISASHNPYRDNGIKFLGPDGRKLDDAAEAAIEAGPGPASGPGGGEHPQALPPPAP